MAWDEKKKKKNISMIVSNVIFFFNELTWSYNDETNKTYYL